METVYGILGILVFLGVGYIFLMILVTPYFWFDEYIESQEEKHRESRESYRRMREEQKANGVSEKALASTYKPVPKGIVGKVTQNHVVVVTTEWLVTWGLFLAIEALLAWNLYKGFEFIIVETWKLLERILGV